MPRKQTNDTAVPLLERADGEEAQQEVPHDEHRVVVAAAQLELEPGQQLLHFLIDQPGGQCGENLARGPSLCIEAFAVQHLASPGAGLRPGRPEHHRV